MVSGSLGEEGKKGKSLTPSPLYTQTTNTALVACEEGTHLTPTYLPLLSAMRIFDFIVANGTGGSELGGREGRCS